MFYSIEQTLKKCVLKVIFFYKKLLSPLLGPCCRFYPSCSDYSQTVFLQQPFIKALVLSIKRLLKCHPWHPGGFDYPPIKENDKDQFV